MSIYNSVCSLILFFYKYLLVINLNCNRFRFLDRLAEFNNLPPISKFLLTLFF